jgi:D-arabinose 1-dehydrogenase-like Zn-dependent alcohol dehydrogenase
MSKKMKAVVIEKIGKSLVIKNDIIVSESKPGGILAKPSASGFCHTDVEVLKGTGIL